MPASDPNHPLPFGNGSVYPETVRYGMLTADQAGAVALASDNSGLETWVWNPGNGSPASGYWTQVGQHGPFANGWEGTDWMSSPAYYSTIQFIPTVGDATTYGIAGRAAGGMVICTWHSTEWQCVLTNAFSNSDITASEHDGPADYYYSTIQFADIYSGSSGAELIGRAHIGNGGLRVYTWNDSSLALLDLPGDLPFDFEWNKVAYSGTIQPAQFKPGAATEQVVGRTGANGLEWWGIKESGCSGASPCWENLTISPRTPFFTDSQGYHEAQYYSTVQVADIDGDGYVEALGRDPSAGFVTHMLSTRADRWSNTFSGPTLTSGPHADLLWANPSYYDTIQTGDVDGDGDEELLARGKYGIRTWAWDSVKGWQRPLPYGFAQFPTARQQAAFGLLNGYLAIAGGNTIRNSYTSLNTSVMVNYQDCLNDSIQPGQTMPPTSTCGLVGPEQPLANPRSVSAEDWKSMVEAIQVEIAMASAVDGHFNQSVASILNALYVLDQAEFDQIIQSLFPGGSPSNSTGIQAILQALFFGLASDLAQYIPFGLGSDIVTPISGVVSAVESLQTSSDLNTTIQHLQTHIAEAAADAIEQSNAFFEYVANDSGLLNLYGTLISDQVWEIQRAQHDTAIATGQYSTARWIYKTLLPHKWGIWVCATGGDDISLCEQLADDPHIGVNAAQIPSDHNYIAFLSEHREAPAPVSSGEHLRKKLFDPIQSHCPLAASAAGAWKYAGCNLGIPLTDVLYYEDGWNLSCMVATLDIVDAYQCGTDGRPPRDYPPHR